MASAAASQLGGIVGLDQLREGDADGGEGNAGRNFQQWQVVLAAGVEHGGRNSGEIGLEAEAQGADLGLGEPGDELPDLLGVLIMAEQPGSRW
ncbi:hypothetical protein AAHB37_00905 [Glutamicibacter halophytocola]